MANQKKRGSAPTKAVTAVKKDDTKLGFFQKVKKWLREMKSELKKVVWPAPQTLIKNVGVALGVMAASAVVLWGFDELATMLVNALFTLAG